MSKDLHFHGVAIAVICCTRITISAQEIDLTGKIVDAGGAGIKNAFVKLTSAGMGDTTESNGAFHLSRKPVNLSKKKDIFFFPNDGRAAHSRNTPDKHTEFFDLSGKRLGILFTQEKTPVLQFQKFSHPDLCKLPASLIIVREHRDDRSILSKAMVLPGETGSISLLSRDNALAKTTADVDTLEIIREGYLSRKVAITDYIQDLGSLELQKEVVEDTFTIRKPSEWTLSCPDRLSGGSVESKFWDIDLLCESNNDSLQATVYIQAQPDSCVSLMIARYRYKVEKAWVKIDGSIQPISPASYDWGGNHHNDWVRFTLNGKIYKLYHSSFGFGWRACTRPDCMQICEDAECRTIRYDGCKRTACSDVPPLKVTCVQIKNDGSVPGLLDPWSAHGENSTYPLLPCRGDGKCK